MTVIDVGLARLKFGKNMNIPDAVMIKGTMSGEIIKTITAFRNGICGRLRSSPHNTPRIVARKVAANPIKKLFQAPSS